MHFLIGIVLDMSKQSKTSLFILSPTDVAPKALIIIQCFLVLPYIQLNILIFVILIFYFSYFNLY